MKDLPHHRQQLNKKTIRSLHRQEVQDEQFPEIPPRPLSEKQKKKQAKEHVRQEKLAQPPHIQTPEERNKKMLHRVPVFDRINNAKPKLGARPTHKKTPRI
jgi:hypothetical protein